MAKDKDKNKSKAAATESDFAKPSDAPATGGDGWKFESEDHLGDLFLITPLREHEIEDTYSKVPGATKTVIVADIVHINEKKPGKSEVHDEAWVFGGWTKGSLRGYIGERKVLGRLGQGKPDRGNTPWILEDADNDDIETAKAYLATVDPFAQKGADKAAKTEAEPDGKKAKKKKAGK